MKDYTLKCYEGYHPRIKVSEEFVKENKFSFNRSQEEILNKIKSRDDEIFDMEYEVYAHYLNKENIKPFLKEESKSEEWEPITDIYETTQDMLDYMVYAWMKALDERGLSASRSVQKIGAWLWILGRDDLYVLINRDDLYNPYGTPALIAVCEKLNIPVPEDVITFSKNKC